MTTRVVHYKRTPLANAPDDLSVAINKYSKWESSVVMRPEELPTDGTLVHFHNQFVPYDGPKLIQYHSEPENHNVMIPGKHQGPDLPDYRLVVAQYQATLPQYINYGCIPARNLIDWREPLFNPQHVPGIRVGYSPSIKSPCNRWFDKGYSETLAVLAQVQSDYPGFTYDVIHGAPYNECITRKNQCSIIIDECVTGSYHRSALEGAALDKLTICWLSDEVLGVLRRVTGTRRTPFTNLRLSDLRAYLGHMCGHWTTYTNREMSRKWMEKYWRPEDIVAEYLKHYEKILTGNSP